MASVRVSGVGRALMCTWPYAHDCRAEAAPTAAGLGLRAARCLRGWVGVCGLEVCRWRVSNVLGARVRDLHQQPRRKGHEQLAKAHVEGRAAQRAVRLPRDDHIWRSAYGARRGRRRSDSQSREAMVRAQAAAGTPRGRLGRAPIAPLRVD
eukprot:6082503-Prymnesium_polylepis.1